MPTLSSESAAGRLRVLRLLDTKRWGFRQGGRKPILRDGHQVARVAPGYTRVDTLEHGVTPGPIPESPQDGSAVVVLTVSLWTRLQHSTFFCFFSIFLFFDFGSWCWVEGCFLLRDICQCLGTFFDEYD